MGSRARRSVRQAEKNKRAIEVDHLMGDLGRRAAHGGAITVVAQIVKLVIQLATLAIMARLLSPADFGLVAMATAVTLFVGMFTDLGLSAATVQRKEIASETVSALFYINLAIGIVIAAITIAAAPLAAWAFGDPRVSGVVMMLAVQIPFVAAGAQHNALLRRGMRWITLNSTGIAAQFVGAAVGIGLAWKTDVGYWALVAQSWAAAIVGLVLVWATCPWRPGKVGDWTKVQSAIDFGLHLTGFNFLNYINRQFDDVLIGWRWGAAELGYYTRAYQLLLLPLALVNNPISTAVIPALSRLQEEPAKWREAYLEALKVTLLASCGVATLLVATAKPLVIVLLGTPWVHSSQIFLFLAISMFASVVMNCNGWIYISLGRTKRMFRWNFLVASVLATAFLIGLPYGGIGVATAYSIAIWLLVLPSLAVAAHRSPVTLADIIRSAGPVIAIGGGVAGLVLLTESMFFSVESYLHRLLIFAFEAGILYTAGVAILLMNDSAFTSTKVHLIEFVKGQFARFDQSGAH